MNLVIDTGNTSTKMAVFNDTEMLADYKRERLTAGELEKIKDNFPEVNSLIISSVVRQDEQFNRYCHEIFDTIINLSHETRIPVKVMYQTPETLGNDRIADVVGAWKEFPNEDVLVIDTGSCITYDFINKRGEYLGGNISPGLTMRFRALNNFTDQLPLVSRGESQNVLGKSTKEAIMLGVQHGLLQEIQGIISLVKNEYPDLKVILTGGDLPFFEKDLKNLIFADPFLTLKGLNEILKYNAR